MLRVCHRYALTKGNTLDPAPTALVAAFFPTPQIYTTANAQRTLVEKQLGKVGQGVGL